jgi:hypothetical protein
MWLNFLIFSNQNPLCTSPFPHTCYIPCPSQPSWFNQANEICWGVQIIKLLVM